MASLKAIRTAAAALLENLPGIVAAYPTIPEVAQVPAIVVDVDTANYVVAMGRGTDTWNLDLHVLCPYADAGLGQDALDEYVTGAGPASVRQAVFLNKTLGLDGTDAHVADLLAYGAKFETASIQHIGATLRLVVHTRGSE